MSVGVRMKIKRIEKEITQDKLRKKAKVGLNTIVALEKGRIDGVRVGTLKKIAEALDSTVQELFFDEK